MTTPCRIITAEEAPIMLDNMVMPTESQIERTARMFLFIAMTKPTEAALAEVRAEAREFLVFYLNRHQILGQQPSRHLA